MPNLTRLNVNDLQPKLCFESLNLIISFNFFYQFLVFFVLFFAIYGNINSLFCYVRFSETLEHNDFYETSSMQLSRHKSWLIGICYFLLFFVVLFENMYKNKLKTLPLLIIQITQRTLFRNHAFRNELVR